MNLDVTEDVKTVSELKKNVRSIFQQIHRTGRPVLITVKGKPDMVLVKADQYERAMRGRDVELLLEQGEKSIREKGTRPFRQFLGELKRAKKIPR
jgi:prevent-host-death family protein